MTSTDTKFRVRLFAERCYQSFFVSVYGMHVLAQQSDVISTDKKLMGSNQCRQ
jgi:hypothetical protein